MDQKSEDKEDPGATALEKFFSQFGEMDDKKRIVLEEFFRELLGYDKEEE